jgi:hypothetical protein
MQRSIVHHLPCNQTSTWNIVHQIIIPLEKCLVHTQEQTRTNSPNNFEGSNQGHSLAHM